MPRPPSMQRLPDILNGAKDIRRMMRRERLAEDRAFMRKMITHLEDVHRRSGFLSPDDVSRLTDYRRRYGIH